MPLPPKKWHRLNVSAPGQMAESDVSRFVEVMVVCLEAKEQSPLCGGSCCKTIFGPEAGNAVLN